MDAPLIVLDDAANTTDVYAFVRSENGRKSLVTALGVYPFEEPGIGPNKFNFDDNVLYAIHVALGKDVAAGRPTLSYEFRFTTRYKNRRTILQSYLGVVNDVNDANQNLTQFYSVTKVDHRTGQRTRLGSGHRAAEQPGHRHAVLQPGRRRRAAGQGRRRHRATSSIATRSRPSPSLDDGYLAFAGQRDDGFYADIQAVFDLLQLRNPGQDAQRGFNLHLMALAIPIDELGGDHADGRRLRDDEPRALDHPVRRAAQARARRRLGPGRAPGQSAVQRRPRGDRGQGPLQPHVAGVRQRPLPQVRARSPSSRSC